MLTVNLLLIGSGGREHALAWALSDSPMLGKLYCAPGNAGIAAHAECVSIDVGDHQGVIAFCREHDIGLVVIGPEVPLVAGLADDLRAAGIKTFGPSKAAAQLEGSKHFTKTLCTEHNIPTAAFAAFAEQAAALAYIREKGAPLVVKADGLAAGKGVFICQTLAEAEAAVEACLGGELGAAGASIVIEELMVGEEASFFALCDGVNVLPLATAQDHKRAFDGDAGPNTGGMGAYSPAPVMTPEMTARAMEEIVLPTVKAMQARGTPFQGVLYAGLMITAEGPKLVEYNVRFGDPECQVLMMRLRSDLLAAFMAAVDGALDGFSLRWSDDPSLTVVMASKGYPGDYAKGSEIHGLNGAAAQEGVMIFHAGTRRDGDRILANGGRVLNVTATARTIAEARTRAYAACAAIDWPQGFYRRDIGWRAMERGRDDDGTA
jgi:phosphoribosylamine--glycine ligase